MLDGNTAALTRYETDQYNLEKDFESFESSQNFREKQTQKMIEVLSDSDRFWEALGYEGACRSSAQHKELIDLIVRKDDAVFGQKIRQWIESYVASEVSILMDQEFHNARD